MSRVNPYVINIGAWVEEIPNSPDNSMSPGDDVDLESLSDHGHDGMLHEPDDDSISSFHDANADFHSPNALHTLSIEANEINTLKKVIADGLFTPAARILCLYYINRWDHKRDYLTALHKYNHTERHIIDQQIVPIANDPKLWKATLDCLKPKHRTILNDLKTYSETLQDDSDIGSDTPSEQFHDADDGDDNDNGSPPDNRPGPAAYSDEEQEARLAGYYAVAEMNWNAIKEMWHSIQVEMQEKAVPQAELAESLHENAMRVWEQLDSLMLRAEYLKSRVSEPDVPENVYKRSMDEYIMYATLYAEEIRKFRDDLKPIYNNAVEQDNEESKLDWDALESKQKQITETRETIDQCFEEIEKIFNGTTQSRWNLIQYDHKNGLVDADLFTKAESCWKTCVQTHENMISLNRSIWIAQMQTTDKVITIDEYIHTINTCLDNANKLIASMKKHQSDMIVLYDTIMNTIMKAAHSEPAGREAVEPKRSEVAMIKDKDDAVKLDSKQDDDALTADSFNPPVDFHELPLIAFKVVNYELLNAKILVDGEFWLPKPTSTYGSQHEMRDRVSSMRKENAKKFFDALWARWKDTNLSKAEPVKPKADAFHDAESGVAENEPDEPKPAEPEDDAFYDAESGVENAESGSGHPDAVLDAENPPSDNAIAAEIVRRMQNDIEPAKERRDTVTWIVEQAKKWAKGKKEQDKSSAENTQKDDQRSHLKPFKTPLTPKKLNDEEWMDKNCYVCALPYHLTIRGLPEGVNIIVEKTEDGQKVSIILPRDVDENGEPLVKNRYKKFKKDLQNQIKQCDSYAQIQTIFEDMWMAWENRTDFKWESLPTASAMYILPIPVRDSFQINVI